MHSVCLFKLTLRLGGTDSLLQPGAGHMARGLPHRRSDRRILCRNVLGAHLSHCDEPLSADTATLAFDGLYRVDRRFRTSGFRLYSVPHWRDCLESRNPDFTAIVSTS